MGTVRGTLARRGLPALAVGLALAVLGAGCGRDAAAGGRSAPESLRRAGSATEAGIELILAGKRDRTIRSAQTFDKLAHGELADDLEGKASKEELGELQARAAELLRIAPEGEPLAVALAASRAFELVAGFFGRYETEVPGAVSVLDSLDFEAKLRALGHELDPFRTVVDRLTRTWAGVSSTLPSGDDALSVRGRFDAHVAAMTALAAAGDDFDGMAKEAGHGLDLIDELEQVYEG